MNISKQNSVALDGSIGKWTKIVTKFDLGWASSEVAENGMDGCPLCLLNHPYKNGRSNLTGCGDCPIAMNTGSFCEDSPYDAWEDQRDRNGAQAMLDYLVELKDKCTVIEDAAVAPT